MIQVRDIRNLGYGKDNWDTKSWLAVTYKLMFAAS